MTENEMLDVTSPRTSILMPDNRVLQIKVLEETAVGSLDARASEISKMEVASDDRYSIGVFKMGTRENIWCRYICTSEGLFWWKSVSGKWLFATVYREDIDTDMAAQTLQKAKYAWPLKQEFETEFREEI